MTLNSFRQTWQALRAFLIMASFLSVIYLPTFLGWNLSFQTAPNATPNQTEAALSPPEESPIDYNKRFIVFFNATLPPEMPRQILKEFPQVTYLQDWHIPQVTVVEIQAESAPVLEKLRANPWVDLVLADRPGLICHGGVQ